MGKHIISTKYKRGIYERREIIRKAILDNIPKKRIVKSRFPSWFSSELIKVIQKKVKCHKLYKITKDLNYYYEFSNLRKRSKMLLKRDKQLQLN